MAYGLLAVSSAELARSNLAGEAADGEISSLAFSTDLPVGQISLPVYDLTSLARAARYEKIACA
jgi:hypothetical protein